ncbi:MSEP-CTERM protein [Pedobacter sp. ok626]|uniref:MSEP-CTERM sorting domain-containing protein n=1 Tax=Pedobacter sp. ok626 TaxID=1761882 RepID=UPI000886CF1F|nr:MSEP-CTERM sorting domain-containing protein [Pedobacter sp. ok626]SDJ75476.1 MSEP-CTERM protein [Pedobacter sp. ok626]
MKNLLNSRWLLLINILPVTLLFIIFFGNYKIIESLLTAESKTLWCKFSLALIALTALQLGYIIFCVIKKQNISIFYALLALVFYISLLYCYAEYSSIVIPNNIPNWMISSEAIFYPGTFLMPTLAHALFVLVVLSSPKPKTINIWQNFIYGISVPIASYLFIQIILPLWRNPENSFGTHILIILFIVASTLFLFFICRAIYNLTNLQSDWLLKHAIYWKIIIALLLPLLGLCFNNGLISIKNGLGESIFGNFKHPWFYIIASINGILVCLPPFKNNVYRLIRFFGLLICFPYTIYFFLIFLPYLPLAIIAVIAIGIGFLMLAPLFLFILQTNELYKEFQYLKQNYSLTKITIGIISSLSIIPLTITCLNLRDKTILNSALEYVYSPDYSKSYSVDRESLSNVLTIIKQNKGRNTSFSNDNTPFITPYYNWLVLNNMILSDVKINTLEQIFFGEAIKQTATVQNSFISTIKLSKIKSRSMFDEKQQAWISSVDLELTNPDSTNLASYEIEFTLPEGCWISNYYLDIENRREHGILTEKKSALWIFSQIRNENRDPGILYYLTGNKIAFKIFPFAAKEVRKSRITFIHKEPVTLNFDGETVSMGNTRPNNPTKVETINNTFYIPPNEKIKLQLVKRKPVYHLIIDVSKDKAKNIRSYCARIENFIINNHIKKEDIRLQLTNSYSTESLMSEDWKTKLSRQPFDGGFYLEGTIKKILANNYKNNGCTFPIMIVLTNGLENAIMQNDFLDFKITYPENSNFYELDGNHKLWIHTLSTNPKSRLSSATTVSNSIPVYAWPNPKNPIAYLPKDNQPSIVIGTKPNTDESQTEKKSWLSGLNLQGIWIRNTLNPSPSNHPHFKLVKQSIISGILSPSTSFIVVENKAQKMALLKKQKQILSGNKNLDPDEETQSMAEPNLYLLMALLLAISIYRFKKNIFYAP